MKVSTSVQARVEGPTQEEEGQRYTVRDEIRDVEFWVVPETRKRKSGWGLRIAGLPDPPIYRPTPWCTVEQARDAAIAAIQDMLALERVQLEEMRRARG